MPSQGLFSNRPTLVDNVRSMLIERIEGGNYESLGGRLPSEYDLSREFGVSRSTIRDALTSLELEGIVIRRRGLGTFIDAAMMQSALRMPPYENTGFLRLIRRSGHQAKYDVLRSHIEPLGKVAARLDVGSETAALFMEKLFFSDDIPAILCVNAVPLNLLLPEFKTEVEKGYYCSESVYSFLRVKCNRVVEYHDSAIRAIPCDERIASLLNCDVGRPIMQLEEVAYSKDQHPLFYGLSYFRSDLIGFRFRRGLGLDFAGGDH